MPSKADSIFDPAVESQPESYLGYSKGYDSAGEAIGTAIKGVGDLFKETVRATDQIFNTKAKEGVETAVDAEQNKYLGQLADALPGPLQSGLDRVNMFELARRQGKVSETYYWNNLDIEARKLRSQYPGYRDVIDSEFHKMTGSIPANALIKNLERDINANQTASQTQFNNEMHWARDHGTPQIAAKIALGQTPSMAELTLYNSQHGKTLADIKNAETKLTYEASQGKATDRSWANAAQDLLGSALETNLTRADSLANGKARRLDDMIQQAQKSGSPEDKQAALTFFAQQVKEPYLKERDEIFYNRQIGPEGSKTTYARNVKEEDRAKIYAIGDARIKTLEDAITNNTYGLLNSSATWIKLAQEGDHARALNVQFNRNIETARKVLGDQTVSRMFETGNPGPYNNLNKAWKDLMATQAILPNSGFADLIKSNAAGAAQIGLPPETANRISLEAHVDLIADNQLPIQARSNAVKSLFANPNFYAEAGSKSKNPEDAQKVRDQLWSKVTSPAVTAAIQDIAKSGDPAALETYNNAVKTMFGVRAGQGGSEIRNRIASGQENDRYVFSYNPKTYMFGVEDRNPHSNDLPEEQTQLRIYEQITRRMNMGQLNFANARKAAGASPEEINQDLEKTYRVTAGLDIKALAPKLEGKTQDDIEKSAVGEAVKKGQGTVRPEPPAEPRVITGPKGVTPDEFAPKTGKDRIPKAEVPPFDTRTDAMKEVDRQAEGTPPEPRRSREAEGNLSEADRAAQNPFHGDYFRMISSNGKYYIVPRMRYGTDEPATDKELFKYLRDPAYSKTYGRGYDSLSEAHADFLKVEEGAKKITRKKP